MFYFAVASAITPPVAIAAFAASTISKAEPLATGFSAVRAGIVVFTIPFVFAFYPEILLIEQAQIAQSLDGQTTKSYLPGYDGTIDGPSLSWLLVRLVLALYLVASALTKFDSATLSTLEVIGRLLVAVLLLIKSPYICVTAFIVGIIMITLHKLWFHKNLA